MFEKRKLRDILLQGTEMKRGLKVIACGELHDQVKKNEIGWAYGMYKGEGKCIKVFGGKAQWKETLRRNRRREKDNIKIDLK